MSTLFREKGQEQTSHTPDSALFPRFKPPAFSTGLGLEDAIVTFPNISPGAALTLGTGHTILRTSIKMRIHTVTVNLPSGVGLDLYKDGSLFVQLPPAAGTTTWQGDQIFQYPDSYPNVRSELKADFNNTSGSTSGAVRVIIMGPPLLTPAPGSGAL